eukprot:TRINITY_DN23299_c0_g2_i1.p1 TRINITY_DN23299_c0_g2~~TRINITY_DN23299_c0_g2_i1.p1  ORF type:complete len:1478 (+),score=244.25 TRINITY_DN23299_c0_g2_i1:66-4499(+)
MAGEQDAVWSVVYHQQWLDAWPCMSCSTRASLDSFLECLSDGQRGEGISAEALKLSNRVLRRGLVQDRIGGTTVLIVLWTTDFAYLHDRRAHQEVVQIWAVCAPKEEAGIVDRIGALWGQSLRKESSLRAFIRRPRQREELGPGSWREWPREVPCGKDLDMAWLSKFIHFPHDMRRQWAAGEEVLWDRLPIVGTAEQQRHVLAEGPLVLVGRAGSGKTVVLRDRLWHHYVWAQSLQQCKRQVFLTLSPSLAQSAAQHFIEAQRQYFPDAAPACVESDIDIDLGLSGLPEAPCFFSFRSFIKLLDAEHRVGFFEPGMVEAEFERLAPSPPDGKRKVEITYLGFLKWFYLKFGLRKHALDPLIVWSEIQSFIKGHPLLQKTLHGLALTRQQYADDISKRQAVGLNEERDEIFNTFLAYQKWCAKNSCFDRMDMTQQILCSLRQSRHAKWIHWLYIDEVQDLTLAEVELCLLCLYDLNGASFGGDTTQTVSQGVSFRFCDLDTLLMKSAESRRVKSPPLGVRAELTVNHRSHMGLVSFSNLLVQLLETLFPWTLDKLSPACSSLSGPKPMVVDANGTILDLGSEQVFLSSSDSVSLPDEWWGAVATPAQVKGLEFTDVVLLDWWSLTSHRVLWEKLLDMESELQKHWSYQDGSANKSYKDWQVASRMPLSKELKQLFVAVTRAQHSLLICDRGPDLALSARVYAFLERIGVLTRNDTAMDGFRQRSIKQRTPESFKCRGDQFFEKDLIDLAQKMWCQAADLYRVARNFQAACSLYRLAGQWHRAAFCLEHEGDFEAAAVEFERLKLWEDAARCHIRAFHLWGALALADRVSSVDAEVAGLLAGSDGPSEQALGKAMNGFLDQERNMNEVAPVGTPLPLGDISQFLLQLEVGSGRPDPEPTDLLRVCGASDLDIKLLDLLAREPNAGMIGLGSGVIVLPKAISLSFISKQPLRAWPSQFVVLGISNLKSQLWPILVQCLEKAACFQEAAAAFRRQSLWKDSARCCTRVCDPWGALALADRVSSVDDEVAGLLARSQRSEEQALGHAMAAFLNHKRNTPWVVSYISQFLPCLEVGSERPAPDPEDLWRACGASESDIQLLHLLAVEPQAGIVALGAEDEVLPRAISTDFPNTRPLPAWPSQFVVFNISNSKSQLWQILVQRLEKTANFQEAVAAYERQGFFKEAAAVYEHQGCFKEAAAAFERQSLWKEAARCHIKRGRWWRALKLADRIPSVGYAVARALVASRKDRERELGKVMGAVLRQQRTGTAYVTNPLNVMMMLECFRQAFVHINLEPGVIDIWNLIRFLETEASDQACVTKVWLSGCGATQMDLRLLELLATVAQMNVGNFTASVIVIPHAMGACLGRTSPLVTWPSELATIDRDYFHAQVQRQFPHDILNFVMTACDRLPELWSSEWGAAMEIAVWCAQRLGKQAAEPLFRRIRGDDKSASRLDDVMSWLDARQDREVIQALLPAQEAGMCSIH